MATRTFSAENIRADFPILSKTVNGHPLVYLDNAATSQKPKQVLDAMRRYYEEANANAHRGVHFLAEQATKLYEEAREKVAKFVNARPREVVFVRNATEGINLVAHAWGDFNVEPGDEILVTVMEHHSNLVPWQMLAQRKGAKLKAVGLTKDGRLDVEGLYRALSPKVRLVAITHVSNVLGTINPVAEIVRAAHDVGAKVLVDGAQAVPHLPVDFRALQADFYAFSGHKMLGPMGIGVIVIAEERYAEMQPFLGGGEMIRDVKIEASTYADPPWRFEAGTPNVEGAVGLAAAVDYLTALGMENVAAHTKRLGTKAFLLLSAIPSIRLFGPGPGPDFAGSVVTFTLKDLHPHDLAQTLDLFGIAIRAGHHCAKPLMNMLMVDATARASFYIYNTEAEVEFFAETLQRIGSGERQKPVSVIALDGDEKDILLEHYLNPEGQEPVEGAQVEWWGKNPVCGDEVKVTVRLEGEKIDGLQVLSRGCSISIASGSIMAGLLKGRTIAEAMRILNALKAMFRGEPLPRDMEESDLRLLRGVKDLPVRIKCALLAWTTFEEAMKQNEKGVIHGYSA